MHTIQIGGLSDGGVLPPEAARLRLDYALSWTAYLSQTWRFVWRAFLLIVVYTLAVWILRVKHTSVLANAGVFVTLALAVAWTLYDIACLRAVTLKIGLEGVWLHYGLFPWSKGVTGLRWDEVGGATFSPSFVSWACKSYGVSVSHRFTTSEELYLAHVQDGHLAVETINRILTAHASLQ